MFQSLQFLLGLQAMAAHTVLDLRLLWVLTIWQLLTHSWQPRRTAGTQRISRRGLAIKLNGPVRKVTFGSQPFLTEQVKRLDVPIAQENVRRWESMT